MQKVLTKRSFSLALTAVAVAAITGCGGGSSDVVATPSPISPNPTTKTFRISVTPVLGAVYGAIVEIFTTSGVLVGKGTTGTKDGKYYLTVNNYTPGTPVIVKVTLPVGSEYFNEKRGINETVTQPVALLSLLPNLSDFQKTGVTPFTNVAAKFSGVTADMVGEGKDLSKIITVDKIYEGLARTILALGLPPEEINLLGDVIAASVGSPLPNDPQSQLLIKIGKESIARDPIEAAKDMLSAALITGNVNIYLAYVFREVFSIISGLSPFYSYTFATVEPDYDPSPEMIKQTAAICLKNYLASMPTGAFSETS